ncbi:MAG: HIT family protein [bacterium]
MDCLFCKIAFGEIPSYKVYEDENFLGFLDIRPLNLGHCLIIPKKHYRWVWDLPVSDEKGQANVGEYFTVAAKIANAQRKAFNTDWVVSVILGEEVPHAHIQLIPRFSNDGHNGSIKMNNRKQFSEEEMRQAAEKIKKEI